MILPAPRHILVLLLILAAEFAVLEGALRLYGGSESSSEFQSLFTQDARIGHRLRAGARATFTTVEFSTELAINAQGFRDDEDLGPKASNERRVLLLGDSLVMSVQVPLAETFGELLERRLNADDPAHSWRVINGGVQGYGPVQEWLFFDHEAVAFAPDVVLIVVFVGNDAIEAYDLESWLEAGRRVGGAAPEEALNAVRRTVRSGRGLPLGRGRYDLLRARLSGPAPERPLSSYLEDPPDEVWRGLEVARDAFSRIATRAADVGASTGFVLMPARFQTDDGDYNRLNEIVRAAGGTLDRQAATERFREALAPLGLPMLDLQPVLAAEPNRMELFFQRNVHLTPRGHRVVAGALADFMETSGLAAAR